MIVAGLVILTLTIRNSFIVNAAHLETGTTRKGMLTSVI